MDVGARGDQRFKAGRVSPNRGCYERRVVTLFIQAIDVDTPRNLLPEEVVATLCHPRIMKKVPLLFPARFEHRTRLEDITRPNRVRYRRK